MSSNEVTKADVLRTLETERAWWRAVFDLAAQNGPVTGDEPVNGYWTFREIIGHVNGWRRWTVDRLESAATGSRPLPPWPDHLDDDSEEAVDEINAWFMEQSRTTSLDDGMAETFALLDQLRDVVHRIPDEQLLTPGVFAHMDPELADLPIGPALIGFSIQHVHEEHAPDLESWLTDRLGQHAELSATPSTFGFAE